VYLFGNHIGLQINELGSSSPWIVSRYELKVGSFNANTLVYGFIFQKKEQGFEFKAGVF
jgi:hypothetical protein